MKEYFEEQLKTIKPITKENLSKLKGKSLYSDYQEGDRIAAFMEQKIGDIEPPYTEPSIELSLKMIVEREMYKLEDNYMFIRMSKSFPVLERKEGES